MTAAPHHPKHAVVVGAGVVGLCCARELRRKGFAVTLVDREAPGSGCSKRNAGLIVPSHFVPLAAPGLLWQGIKWMLDPASPFYLAPRLDFGLLAWLGRFASASRASRCHAAMPHLRDLLAESRRRFADLAHLDFGLETRGLLMLHRTPEGREACHHEAELAVRMGLEARVVKGAELEALEPGGVIRAGEAVFYPDDAHLDPARLCAALAAEFTALGGRTVAAEAEGFELARGRAAALRTSQGAVEGDVFVLALGAWSADFARGLRLHLPMQAGKGYSFDLTPSRMPRLPSILTEARVAVTPLGDQLRLAGTLELSGMDLSIQPRRLAAIHRAPERYLDLDLPPLPPAPWAGLRPCSPDGLPYIGAFPHLPNLIAATGHAMLGVTLAPITGELVAEIAAGEAPTLPLHPFRPERFG
jgi:D-amino-acid dehydrogenase